MDRRQDPRTIVTPYAFSVHPNLLGRPLATPMQRLGAIGVDGVVIFGLTRIGGLSLAIASTLLLFWLAIRKPGKDVFGKLFRAFVGCLGLIVLSITIMFVLIVESTDRTENDPDATGTPGVESPGLGSLLTLAPDVIALRTTEDADEARLLVEEIARAGRVGGIPLQDIRTALEELMPDDAPWSGQSQEMVDAAMASLRRVLPRTGEDTLSMGTGEDRSAITDSVALDSISTLNELIQDRDEEQRDAEAALQRISAQLEEAESGGILGWLLSLIDDLGLGFGWGALYLTIAHTWWKGTSVGKKMFRIRVVMIDQRPLNLWLSFERAGGYAAGLATGLLGFAQIFWDPNRQAIHDKVAETIVIQVGKDPVPGPWIAQGKTQWERDHKQPQDPSKG